MVLFVQDDAEKRVVDRDVTVVTDETKFPEFIHEQIDSRSCGADHFRQSFLRYLRKRFVRPVLLAVASQ